MKKLILMLAMVLPICVFAQENEIESKSKTVELLEKQGVLLRKDFYDIGIVDKVLFQTLIVTDMTTKEKTGALRIEIENEGVSYIGTLDYDELSGCIASLEYIRDNILIESTQHYMECEYQTKDNVEIGVYCRESFVNKAQRIWTFYIKTKSYTLRSMKAMKSDKINDVIDYMRKAKQSLDENLS